MNTLAIIEKIEYLTTEIIWVIAYILHLTWQYRTLIITMLLFTAMFFIGLFGYAIRADIMA